MSRICRAALRLAAAIVALSLVFCAAACAKKPSTPTEAVTGLLEALKSSDSSRAERLMYNPDDFTLGSDSPIDLNEAAAGHLSWEIAGESFDAEYSYYIVEAKITSVDIVKIMDSLTEKYYSEITSSASQGISWDDDTDSARIESDMHDMIASGDAPLTEQDIAIYVVPDGNSWKVFISDDFINAVCGRVLELYRFNSN